jgi:hypothetical protein
MNVLAYARTVLKSIADVFYRFLGETIKNLIPRERSTKDLLRDEEGHPATMLIGLPPSLLRNWQHDRRAAPGKQRAQAHARP